ncbi:MAG: hypothetical protein WC373_13505 [Smithella sp.]|jgi:hypothetical protein
MNELLEYIGSWSALQWIVLVLIAGFIGQFGRMAAEKMAEKIRMRRRAKGTSSEAPIETLAPPPSSPSPTGEIINKKLLKAMAKAKKKEAKKKD